MTHHVQHNRYARQVAVPVFGENAQAILSKSTLAIVGCGALGSLAADLLTRMGIHALRIADNDRVSEQNLHRQLLFTEEDANQQRSKAQVAAKRLLERNHALGLRALHARIDASNMDDFIAGCDLVLDATDNSETRFLLNDRCMALRIPWIYTGVSATAGLVLPIFPDRGPCLRCLYPDALHKEDIAHPDHEGILPTTVVQAVSFQVAAAIKLLTGQQPSGELIRFDSWIPSVRTVRLHQRIACPALHAHKESVHD